MQNWYDFSRNAIGYWGTFPGNYKTDKKEEYTVYGYDSATVDNYLSVKTIDTKKFQIEESYDNITYNPLVSSHSNNR